MDFGVTPIHSDSSDSYYTKIRNHLVGVVVPKNYLPSGQVIIHFHGLRSQSWDARPDGTIGYFKFGEKLPKNVLMVCPIGDISDYTLARDYYSVSVLIPLLADIAKITGDNNFTDVALSAHSAGGRVIPPLLHHGTGKLPVSKVFLFDATYGFNGDPRFGIPDYNAWLLNPNHRLWCVSQEGTPNETRADKITKAKNSEIYSTELSHWNLVRDKFFGDFIKDAYA